MICPTFADDKAETKPTTIVAKVDGMTCMGCVSALTKTMDKRGGVKDIYVNLEKGEVVFAQKKEKPLSKDKIIELIELNGFTAGKISKVEKPFPEVKKSYEAEG